MNKYLYIFILTALLYSCEVEYTNTQKIVFENQSNDFIIYYFESSFGTDTLFIESYCSKEFVKTDRMSVTTSLLGSDKFSLFPVGIINHDEIYNISDTTSYVVSKGGMINYTNNDSLYFKYINNSTTSKDEMHNRIIETRIVYSDNFPNILVKDTSMLNKFKEYYK